MDTVPTAAKFGLQLTGTAQLVPRTTISAGVGLIPMRKYPAPGVSGRSKRSRQLPAGGLGVAGKI